MLFLDVANDRRVSIVRPSSLGRSSRYVDQHARRAWRTVPFAVGHVALRCGDRKFRLPLGQTQIDVECACERRETIDHVHVALVTAGHGYVECGVVPAPFDPNAIARTAREDQQQRRYRRRGDHAVDDRIVLTAPKTERSWHVTRDALLVEDDDVVHVVGAFEEHGVGWRREHVERDGVVRARDRSHDSRRNDHVADAVMAKKEYAHGTRGPARFAVARPPHEADEEPYPEAPPPQ